MYPQSAQTCGISLKIYDLLQPKFLMHVLLDFYYKYTIQGVLAWYDFWDLEKIVLCEIRTSGYYIANFH